MTRLTDAHGVRERLTLQVRIDQAGDGTELVQREQVPEKLRPILDRERHHITLADAECPIGRRMAVDMRVGLRVAVAFTLEEQEGVMGLICRPALQLPGERLVTLAAEE